MIAGWVPEIEIKLILKYMNQAGKLGNILEVGSSFGRVFNYLHYYKPDWNYVAVDPWEWDGTRLQLDWSKPYHTPGNTSDVITKDMFTTNCPFALANQSYFEDYKSNEKFDIISIGCMGKKINWEIVYAKAYTMLADNGVIIGRDLYHSNRGTEIQESVKQYTIIDKQDNSFVIRKHGN